MTTEQALRLMAALRPDLYARFGAWSMLRFAGWLLIKTAAAKLWQVRAWLRL